MTPTDALGIVADRRTLSDDELADKYSVSVKTVRRVLRGESHSALTGIPRVVADPVRARPYPREIVEAMEGSEPSDAVMAYFALSGDVAWGMFDYWDGLGHVATDGRIAWLSEELCAYVRRLGGEELPTFGASRIMARSVGQKVERPQIDGRYIDLARARNLEIRVAVGAQGYVYLTKSKSRLSADDFSTVVAAVTVLR